MKKQELPNRITNKTEYLTNGKQILKLGLCHDNSTNSYNPHPGLQWSYGNRLWPRLKGDNLATRETIYSSWFSKGSELERFTPIKKSLINSAILAKLDE